MQFTSYKAAISLGYTTPITSARQFKDCPKYCMKETLQYEVRPWLEPVALSDCHNVALPQNTAAEPVADPCSGHIHPHKQRIQLLQLLSPYDKPRHTCLKSNKSAVHILGIKTLEVTTTQTRRHVGDTRTFKGDTVDIDSYLRMADESVVMCTPYIAWHATHAWMCTELQPAIHYICD